jgi:hypothetical protein
VKLAAEQIVGREPRERVSQEAFVNQSWRYRAAAVNSTVMQRGSFNARAKMTI